MNRHLVEVVKKHQGGNALLGRKKGADVPFENPYRDLANCLQMLIQDATICTQQVYWDENSPEETSGHMEVLDTITKSLQLIYQNCMADQIQGLATFQQMYAYLDKYPERSQVYSTFCHFFLQSVFCFLFGAKQMAIGLPEHLGTEVFEFNTMTMILSSLDDPTRKEVLKQLKDAGMWPTKVESSHLMRASQDVMKVIYEAQQKQLEEADAK
jgi:hypothetical protein